MLGTAVFGDGNEDGSGCGGGVVSGVDGTDDSGMNGFDAAVVSAGDGNEDGAGNCGIGGGVVSGVDSMG